MNEIQQLLFDAACAIDTPKKWIRGTLARNAKGGRCGPCSRSAVSFCATGAIRYVSNSTTLQQIDKDLQAEKYLQMAMDGQSIADVNDRNSTTHKDMMMFFAFAIALAGRRL